MDDFENYFYEYINKKPIYTAEGEYVVTPFWEFMYRIQALHRHWMVSKDFTNKHLNKLKKAGTISGKYQEYYDLYAETAGSDVDYIPEQIRGSTISILISLLENLLIQLSEDIAKELKIKIELSENKMPLINKHIYWITKGCGLEVYIPKETNKNLDLIREIRNRFIHNINRDLPDQLKKTLSQIVERNEDTKSLVDDAFVEFSFNKISELVKNIELSYIEFDKKNQIKKMMKNLDIPDDII